MSGCCLPSGLEKLMTQIEWRKSGCVMEWWRRDWGPSEITFQIVSDNITFFLGYTASRSIRMPVAGLSTVLENMVMSVMKMQFEDLEFIP